LLSLREFTLAVVALAVFALDFAVPETGELDDRIAAA
jgi:hypothetical protein